MKRQQPPFRADHVGSLLRTAPIKEARAKREKAELTADQLKAVEDAEIQKIIARQEACGLQLATDGEFRRSWWHFDFLCALDGVEMKQIDHGIQFAGVQTKAERPDVVGKIGFSSHPMIGHFRFLKANTRVTPKMTIPSPTLMHFRFGRASVSKTLYPDLDEFFHDLGQTYANVVRGRFTMRAAAICSSTTRSGPFSALRRSAHNRANAAIIRMSCRGNTPG